MVTKKHMLTRSFAGCTHVRGTTEPSEVGGRAPHPVETASCSVLKYLARRQPVTDYLPQGITGTVDRLFAGAPSISFRLIAR